MKNKNFVILIAILVVLILIYVIQQFSTGRKSVSETVVKIFPDLDSSAVKYIKAYKQDYPDSGISFARQDTGWIVSSYFGATGKKADIEKIITDIKALTGEVRSSNAELLGDYDLTDNQALHLELLKSDSTPMVNMLVGKGVPQSPRSSFIRKNGDNTVYKANENFLSRFAMWDAQAATRIQTSRWLELGMGSIPADSMKSMQLQIKGKTYLFEREKQVSADTAAPPQFSWSQKEPSKGKMLEDKDIAGIANRLGSLRANDLLKTADMAALGLDKPQYVAQVTGSNGSNARFAFGNMADTTSKMRYVLAEGKPFIYKVADYSFQGIF
jgi:hypothetical protein